MGIFDVDVVDAETEAAEFRLGNGESATAISGWLMGNLPLHYARGHGSHVRPAHLHARGVDVLAVVGS